MANSTGTSVHDYQDQTAPTTIKCGSKAAVVIGWIFAALWNAFAGYGLVQCLQANGTGVFIVLPMVIIGLLLIALGVYITAGWMRYGTSEFVMAHPAEPGGSLSGVIRTQTKVLPANGFSLELKCERRRTRGKDRYRTKWKSEQQSVASLGNSDDPFSAIPVQFEIPVDAIASGRQLKHSYLWTLSATGRVEGVDFQASFQVPVTENGLR